MRLIQKVVKARSCASAKSFRMQPNVASDDGRVSGIASALASMVPSNVAGILSPVDAEYSSAGVVVTVNLSSFSFCYFCFR